MIKTFATEDYLKTITSMGLNTKNPIVKLTDIAKRLSISPAAVSDMVKKLAKENLVINHAYKGIELTPKGLKQGTQLIRHHRLWEVFLHNILKMSWDEIHHEAEQLEHAASVALMDKIDTYLNYPKCDPHGNPIPDKQGRITTLKNEKKLFLLQTKYPFDYFRFTNFDSNY